MTDLFIWIIVSEVCISVSLKTIRDEDEYHMSIRKVIGYVFGTAGVTIAVVVAAPVAGAVGTITATGALIAGGSGAVFGGVAFFFDDTEEKAYQKGRKYEAKASKACTDIEVKQMLEKLDWYQAYINGCADYFNSIVSLIAVAVSAISSCRKVTPSERAQLESFIVGHLGDGLPENISIKINSIFDSPPTFNEAYELAMKSELAMNAHDDVIDFALAIVGANDAEVALISQAWSQLKAA